MSNEDAGALFKAVLYYADCGIAPDGCSQVVEAALQFFIKDLDEEAERREEIGRKRSEAVQSRWRKAEDTQPAKPKTPAKQKADPEAIKQRQEAKKEDFYQSLVPFVKVYGKEMVREFFDYWTEPNKSGSKWRFELEKTWDLSRRLNTWASRNRVPSSSCNGNNRTSNQEAAKKRQEDAASIVAELLAENKRDTGC